MAAAAAAGIAAGIAAVPIFSPAAPSPTRRSPSELRFSRWNNAPARELARRLRPQQEIEEDIRRERRFRSAIAIADDSPDAGDPLPPSPRSAGTPSVPSRSSIPGRASKYSKPPKPENPSHPAFRRLPRVFDRPEFSPEVTVSDAGVAYRVPNAPFEFQYSYTETPKVKPLKLREPAVTPFGPMTMSRPWTGRRPLSGTKKLLPEFDSFRPPPPNKKGVKTVQAPGPYLAGSGPRHAMSREEILGEPLTKEEIEDLIKGSLKIRRQLNMGRDGLTHNMLDNIHALWKRRRVCKIKCKGVCTVDMDNVREQLEDKTGGKIIYSRGGVIFLFRGRNYNYRTRPKYPLMLWKPAAPVYPRLVQRVPEGLSLEEANEMRSKGRKLPTICKLGKNGVYCGLVNNVREAFEECELVRINCQGMNKSDYKKIGAKLKDLVPCVLISFEQEHILMWRGRDWKSSFLKDSTQTAADSGPLNLLNESTDNSFEREELSSNNAWSSLVTDESSRSNISDITVSNESTILEHGEVSFYIGKDNQFVETNEEESSGVQTGSAVSIDGDHRVDVKSTVLDFSSDDQSHAIATNEAGFTEEYVDTSQIISETMDDKSVAIDILLEEQVHASQIEVDTDTFNNTRDNQLLETTGSDIDEINGVSENQREDASYVVSHVMGEVNDADTFNNARDNQLFETTGSDTDEINGVSENQRENASYVVSHVAGEENVGKNTQQNKIYTEALLLLMQGAIDSGLAVVLEQNEYMDANVVYQRSVDLAKTAPPGPTLKQKVRNLPVHKNKERGKPQKEVRLVFAEPLTNQCSIEKRQSYSRPTNDDFTFDSGVFVEHGSLGVDELAKLLS